VSGSLLCEHASAIWRAAVEAVDPFALTVQALTHPEPDLRRALQGPGRLIVVGGGKAGAVMAAGIEMALAGCLNRVRGVVNVPVEAVRPLKAIRLHPARPAGTNQPTPEAVEGVRAMLDLVAQAGPEDIGLCLLSGGGSALLPAPPEGITLEQKQQVTLLLHACGATIDEINCVRKHLSRIKGGRLAQAFGSRPLFSFILSDVVGDALDVISSGPTAPDSTSFVDALAVLARYDLLSQAPAAVLSYLQRGRDGIIPDTPKALPPQVHNLIVGNNARALGAASLQAQSLGYPVVNLGSFLEGETATVAVVHAGVVRSIRSDLLPARPPICLLSGGETTVTLGAHHGKGGRNQEFVLACLVKLGPMGMKRVAILSGGTDGEDGPTDAAGAVATEETIQRACALHLDAAGFLHRHDAYSFFERTGDLLRTGLTGTNVMDVRVILISV
jgi:hydroxypyruvate reductase/glycerate 2-kinase